MQIDPKCPITEAKLLKYETYIQNIQTLINKSRIPDLYCVLLQSCFELDAKKNQFSGNNVGKFSSEILSKILNEGWAVIGCFERAAYLSSYHHIRATIESAACYYWVTHNKNKRLKRLEKYFEFEELYLYQLYLRFSSSNENPSKEISLDITFPEERIENWKEKEDKWRKLYKPKDNDLLKVKFWHYDALIENILTEFPNKKLKHFYEEFSHATHFSPFTHSLGTGNTVIGFPISIDFDLTEVNRPITIYLETLEYLLNKLEYVTKINLKVKFPHYNN